MKTRDVFRRIGRVRLHYIRLGTDRSLYIRLGDWREYRLHAVAHFTFDAKRREIKAPGIVGEAVS